MFDRALLWLVRRRLGHFRKIGDHACLFSDELFALLQAEIARRHRLFNGWDREMKANQAAAAEGERRAAAVEMFQCLEFRDRLSRLQ